MHPTTFRSRLAVALIVVALPLFLYLNYYWWVMFSDVYLLLSISFIWLMMFLLFMANYKKAGEAVDYAELFARHEKFTVIIPVYNETSEILERTVESVVAADGVKDILLVDDGSTNGVWHKIQRLYMKYPEISRIHQFSENKGKREAQAWMVMHAKTERIVSIDSNAVYDSRAFVYLTSRLDDSRVGLVTGEVGVLNEHDRLLYTIQGNMMWCASNKARQSLGDLGWMGSACGKLMSFRRADFLAVVNQFLSHQFAGKKVISGDDGFLTSLIMQKGFQVRFEKLAYCAMYPKQTYRSYIVQQLRWKRNIIRRSFWVLQNLWCGKNTLFIVYTIANLLLPFMMISIMLSFLMHVLITGEWSRLLVLTFNVLGITLIQDLVMLYQDRTRYKRFFQYALFNFYVLLPLWPVALFTIDDTGWGTR